LDPFFYLIAMGRGDVSLFLILFWCSAVVGGARTFFGMIPGLSNLIPGWAGANSRLARLPEFAGNRLICLTVFAAKGRSDGEKSTKFPFRREKPGICFSQCHV
jgi:hypothetical protein